MRRRPFVGTPQRMGGSSAGQADDLLSCGSLSSRYIPTSVAMTTNQDPGRPLSLQPPAMAARRPTARPRSDDRVVFEMRTESSRRLPCMLRNEGMKAFSFSLPLCPLLNSLVCHHPHPHASHLPKRSDYFQIPKRRVCGVRVGEIISVFLSFTFVAILACKTSED